LGSQASNCVLPKQADCRDSVEGNGYPHTTQLRKLQIEMNALEPERGALGGYSFNAADSERAGIYPDLTAQKAFDLSLGEDPQNILGNISEVLLPDKSEVIVRPADLATLAVLG
jgi:hypothetical protein